MKAVIVYDSWFGNTREVAEAIGRGLGRHTQIIKVADIPEHYSMDPDYELLIVGCPTHGGTTTPAMQDFLKRLDPEDMERRPVAAFDTRVRGRWLKIIGFASQHIANQLEFYGGVLVMPPEGFYVRGKKGPLVQGELRRAEQWGAHILRQLVHAPLSRR